MYHSINFNHYVIRVDRRHQYVWMYINHREESQPTAVQWRHGVSFVRNNNSPLDGDHRRNPQRTGIQKKHTQTHTDTVFAKSISPRLSSRARARKSFASPPIGWIRHILSVYVFLGVCSYVCDFVREWKIKIWDRCTHSAVVVRRSRQQAPR